MESAIVPGIYDPTLADDDVRVGTEEAYEMTRRLAQEEGLLVGISSGANLAGALKVARKDAVIVVVFCRRRRALSVRALLGESARRRARSAARTDGAGADRVQRTRRFARTAARRFPHECCGALLGRDGVVQRSVRAAEHDRRRPAAALPGAARRLPRRRSSARAKPGSSLLGFYHSHPDHPARPSQYDLDHAWPSFSYVIVSVMAGEDKQLTSWRLQDDRSAFDEETLRSRITRSRDHKHDQDSHSHTAASVHRQARRRRDRRRRPSASCCRT